MSCMYEVEEPVTLGQLAFMMILCLIAGALIGMVIQRELGEQTVERTPTYTLVTFKITAYCPCSKCCGRFADGVTASGYKLKDGDLIVAAPPSIPFGTKIDIPGYGLATVEDRGGAIKEGRLDVFFWTHQQALEWGVQTLDVRVYPCEK